MKKKHVKHRNEILKKLNGLGSHFFNHAEELGINMNTNMEDIMQHFKLFIITSADKYSKEEWKDMEAYFMQTMKTI